MSTTKIGLLTATSLVVANMIGIGVFTSIGFQAGPIPSLPVIMLLWICGGVIALCGGLSYITLSELYPDSGGEYHFIKQQYHPVIAYAAGVISIVAGFSAPVALASLAFSAYLSQLFPSIDLRIVAVGLISLVTLLHCFSLDLSGRVQILTTALKVCLIMAFISFGLAVDGTENDYQLRSGDLDLIVSGDFASALIYVSFAYSGWNACIYIFNEVDNPKHNIPKAILWGTVIVTALYTLVNFVFMKTVKLSELAGVVEVAALSGDAIFGSHGGQMISALIGLLLISNVSAMIWTGSRVVSKMGADILPRSMSFRSGAEPTIPLHGIAIQYVVTIALILTNSFEQILLYASVLMILCSVLSIGSLFLRYRELKLIKLLAPLLFLLANIYSILVLVKD